VPKKFGYVRVDQGDDAPALALQVDDVVVRFADVPKLASCTSMSSLLANWDVLFQQAAEVADQIANGGIASRCILAEKARLRAPIDPPQIFCTGANYRRHVAEIIVDRFSDEELSQGKTREELLENAYAMMDDRVKNGLPYIFTRIASSCAGPFDDLRLAPFSEQPDWEAELGLVFKTGGLNIAYADAMDHVAGFLVVNDITNRDQIFTADPKALGSDWLHAKNSPGYFPIGPMLVPKEFVPDPHDLAIQLRLNGKLMQDERSSDMIFDIPRQIEVLSTYARIMPGDVLATGSPAGNGTHYNRYLRPGDVMEVSVEGLGTQRTRCVAAS